MLHFHHHHHQWHLEVAKDDPPRWLTNDLMMLISFVRDVKNICSACRDSSEEIGENLRWIKIWLFRPCISSCAAAGQLRTRGTFKPQSSGQGWSYHCWRCQPNHNIYQYWAIFINNEQCLSISSKYLIILKGTADYVVDLLCGCGCRFTDYCDEEPDEDFCNFSNCHPQWYWCL